MYCVCAGHLSYYAWRAWCAGARGSRVLLLDRASLRHKRDNKLRTSQPDPVAVRTQTLFTFILFFQNFTTFIDVHK